MLVTFGAATLVIADQKEHPLTHWSLAAVVRVNPGERPALFAPSADTGEVLEIADDDMIDALETVRKTVLRRQPKSGLLRRMLGITTVLGIVGVAAVFGPEALIRQAERTLPEAGQDGIGARVLSAVTRVAGRPCAAPEGTAALKRLTDRLPDLDGWRIAVLPQGPDHALTVPGRWLLIDRRMVEDHDGPEVVAGHILAARSADLITPPMRRLLDAAGTAQVLRLLTTGALSAEVLDSHGEQLMRQPAPTVQDAALLQAFARAKVSARPYAFALDITGETTLGLIEADPVPPSAAEPLLSDRDWLALQGICE